MESLQEVLARADTAYEAGNLDLASVCYEAALRIKPAHWYACFCLGVCMAKQGSDGLAIQLFMQALSNNPEHIESMYNLGLCMRRQGHTGSAREIYKILLQKDPAHFEAMASMSGTFINEGEPRQAVEWGDKALALSPGNPRAEHHKAMGLLELGDYETGFSMYRRRYELPEWTKRAYECPVWDGSPVDTLVIHGEQGIGDEILFMSWLPKLTGYKNLVIECTPRMVKTFRRSFGVPCYGTDREVIANCRADAVLPMGTVPYFAGGLPPQGRYLKPDAARVEHYRRELMKLGAGPYIGLSWHGGVVKTHAHLRTTHHAEWKRFTGFGTCISVQYGQRGAEAADLGIPHWQAAIDDLDELVALIAALDLVVTVNNTTVHMAGALDIPCWTLTPSKPAWRYGLSGETMPWYRSVTQYRQEGREWGPVFDRVAVALHGYARKAA